MSTFSYSRPPESSIRDPSKDHMKRKSIELYQPRMSLARRLGNAQQPPASSPYPLGPRNSLPQGSRLFDRNRIPVIQGGLFPRVAIGSQGLPGKVQDKGRLSPVASAQCNQPSSDEPQTTTPLSPSIPVIIKRERGSSPDGIDQAFKRRRQEDPVPSSTNAVPVKTPDELSKNPASPTNKKFTLSHFKPLDYNLDLRLGREKMQLAFSKNKLCASSTFFQNACTRFHSGNTTIYLVDILPTTFGTYLAWLASETRDINDSAYLTSLSLSTTERKPSMQARWAELTRCYFASEFLGARVFQNTVMDELLVLAKTYGQEFGECIVASPVPAQELYNKARVGSPLRQFVVDLVLLQGEVELYFRRYRTLGAEEPFRRELMRQSMEAAQAGVNGAKLVAMWDKGQCGYHVGCGSAHVG